MVSELCDQKPPNKEDKGIEIGCQDHQKPVSLILIMFLFLFTMPPSLFNMLFKSATTTSWGYEEGHSKGPRSYALPVIADFNSLHKPPALFTFRSISRDHPVTVEPFQFSPSETVAYEGS